MTKTKLNSSQATELVRILDERLKNDSYDCSRPFLIGGTEEDGGVQLGIPVIDETTEGYLVVSINV